MSNITHCEVIVKDDFENILVVQKKVVKNEPKLWSLVGKNKKVNETLDKCVHRILKEELKTIGFDIKEFATYKINDEESNIVFTCVLREKVSCHTSIVGWEWISKKDLEKYNFIESDKLILDDYWEI
ncbi:NUDIX hydrolase [uncultured Clostridium sp.]|uniref:NUDIX hydrolase n=1 Tax=uncultured Clostridium sp. TaxID=59620 RepID=UPI00261DEEF9|nr:NUDIX hydrolase [uncultured Clostridium sp.]